MNVQVNQGNHGKRSLRVSWRYARRSRDREEAVARAPTIPSWSRLRTERASVVVRRALLAAPEEPGQEAGFACLAAVGVVVPVPAVGGCLGDVPAGSGGIRRSAVAAGRGVV